MILVVDANVVISALIKNGKAREILMGGEFQFVAPEFLKDEVSKYANYIERKSGLTGVELRLLTDFLFEKVKMIPHEEQRATLSKALEIMRNDVKDAPYVACYLALKCHAIWTNDTDFYDKLKIKVVTTEDLVRLFGRGGRT